MLLIVDIGCGKEKYPDSIGIDISKHSDADIIANLNSFYFPLKSNVSDIVICQDIIEHIINIENFFKEIFRILKSSGLVKIRTPHYTSRYAYNDHTHHHIFGFDFFNKIKQKLQSSNLKINIKKRKLLFPKLWRILGIEALMNKFPQRYEQLLCYLFPAENMYFEIEIIKYKINYQIYLST